MSPYQNKEKEIAFLTTKIKADQDLRITLLEQGKIILKALDKSISNTKLDRKMDKQKNTQVRNALTLAYNRNKDLNKNLGIRVNDMKMRLKKLQGYY